MKKFFLLAMTALMMLACNNNEPGAMNGVFSVSKSQKVYFSQGNLQYKASTKTWRFATNQYDVLGEQNCYVSDPYDGWIDTFGWGTGKNPTATSSNSADYSKFSEWGNNAIANGGNETFLWRTLSHTEWKYLLEQRRNAAELCGLATVNGVQGCVLLPDNWKSSSKFSFAADWHNYDHNVYSASEWKKMEARGAVFLPAGGWRFGKEMTRVNEYGGYWTSTGTDNNSDDPQAFGFYFDGDDDGIYNNYTFPRRFCMTVRLVQDK